MSTEIVDVVVENAKPKIFRMIFRMMKPNGSDPIEIEFEYDLKQDTSSGVAQEMVEELELA